MLLLLGTGATRSTSCMSSLGGGDGGGGRGGWILGRFACESDAAMMVESW